MFFKGTRCSDPQLGIILSDTYLFVKKEIHVVWLHRTMENGLENERSRNPGGTKLAMQEQTEQQAGYVVLRGLRRRSSDSEGYTILKSRFNGNKSIFFKMC